MAMTRKEEEFLETEHTRLPFRWGRGAIFYTPFSTVLEGQSCSFVEAKGYFLDNLPDGDAYRVVRDGKPENKW